MTAVQGCPACGKTQKKRTLVCHWCGTMFEQAIEPPPSPWPRVLWWGFLALLVAAGLYGIRWFISTPG